MRWWVALIMVIIAVGLDTGLAGVFTIRGIGHATPSFSACLLGYIALQARPRAALWAAVLLGLVLDLSPSSAGAVGGLPIIGPRTLGCIAAVYLIVLLRPVVFRRRLVTVAVIGGLAWVCIGLGSASVETIRWWVPWTHAIAPPPASSRLITVFASALYTVLLGLPAGAFLLSTTRWWRFGAAPGRLDYAANRR